MLKQLYGRWHKTLTQDNGEQQLKALQSEMFVYEQLDTINQAKTQLGAISTNTFQMTLGTRKSGINVDDILVIKHPLNLMKTIECKVASISMEQDAMQMGKMYYRLTVTIRATYLQ